MLSDEQKRLRHSDPVGRRYNRLVVVAVSPGHKRNEKWTVRCDCGAIKDVQAAHLITGSTKSCGCLRRERGAQMLRKHGGNETAEWHAWHQMRQRCGNRSNKSFHRYGGRGITVCERWSSFEVFLADMGQRPGRGYSIDRIDNNGNYEPGNCRWATAKEQSENRSTTHLVTIGGRTQSIMEWARESGLTDTCVRLRLKRGVTGDALLAPSIHGGRGARGGNRRELTHAANH